MTHQRMQILQGMPPFQTGRREACAGACARTNAILHVSRFLLSRFRWLSGRAFDAGPESDKQCVVIITAGFKIFPYGKLCFGIKELEIQKHLISAAIKAELVRCE